MAGRWRVERSGKNATLGYTALERLPAATEREVRDEGAGLVRFAEPEATSYAIEQAALD